MLSKSTKPQSWSSRIEIDMSVDSSDSEEDIAHLIQEKWWQSGLKNSSETLKESKESFPLLSVLLSNPMS